MGVCARFAVGGIGSTASQTGSKGRTHGAGFPTKNTPPSRANFLSLPQKPHEAGNILKTKDEIWCFSVPEAENILKISQLFAIQENGYCMTKCQSPSRFIPSKKREVREDCCDKKTLPARIKPFKNVTLVGPVETLRM